MTKNIRSGFLSGFLLGLAVGLAVTLTIRMASGVKATPAEAAWAAPRAMFVNLVNFPLVKPGKNTEFLEWFRWSNEVYAKYNGFLSRTLLRSIDSDKTDAAIVEHESKETFMAMHMSQDREEAFKRVQPLLDGRPTPHFYEVVISHRK